MKLTRYIKPAQIKLELDAKNPTEIPEGANPEKILWQVKESVLSELVELLDTSGKVVNSKKLYTDLVNRERRATTGIGGGIAIPHVRTMQARSFSIAFARSTSGVDFGAIDGKPVHLFICVVAPPYDDNLYLKVYKSIGEIFGREETRKQLLSAKDGHEIVKILSSFE